ncbi:MAG: hypothetical protein M3Q66_03590, partial [Chloroflexota bacterium]|nr:hypothetical protein [Chloroflexota bacterium]
MTEEAARRRVLDRIGVIIGQQVPDDPELIAALEGSLDGSLEVSGWVEMEHRLDEIQPLLGGSDTKIDDVGLEVEEVFQSTVARLGDSAHVPETLRGESPGVRMLVATRVVEGAIADGGWSAVFYNDVVRMVPL